MTVHENDSRRLKIYTTTWCGDCMTAKAVLDRAGVAYEAIDIDHDPAAVATVLAINGGFNAVPTIVFQTVGSWWSRAAGNCSRL